jgi:hypothetical protein
MNTPPPLLSSRLPAASPTADETKPVSRRAWKARVRFGLSVTLFGLILYLLGVAPNLFNLDRSPVTGFIQIAVFLVGLAFICLGGYTCLNALWNGLEKTILADIGLRLVSTGYVISVASGMADIFGFGTHPLPRIPYFGPYQAIGLILGEIVIALGFLLLIPYPPRKRRRK